VGLINGGTGPTEEITTEETCILCKSSEGMSSCWYTTGTPEDLCERVYPGGSGTWHMVGCKSNCCTMN
jgi:hypothetical protein